MKGNLKHSQEWKFEYMHRLVQSLCLSLVLLSHWQQSDYPLLPLVFITLLLLYPSLTFKMSVYPQAFSNFKLIVQTIRFIDGIIIGTLLCLLVSNPLLDLGILLACASVYLRLPKASVISTTLGVIIAVVLAQFYSLPRVEITLLIQAIIIFLLIGFAVSCELVKNLIYAQLADKYQSLSKINSDLRLHTFRLSKYLSPVLRKVILAGGDVRVTAQEKTLTIFFSDMQGFSKMSEKLSSEELTWVLNSYLTEMSEIVFQFGGTLDKVIGDSLMVFFGDPDSRGAKTDATACVCMALAMAEAMEGLKQRWIARGINSPPSLRMGIHTGNCKVGNFGTENRLEYTALGSAVNLASHLESAAGGGEIIVSEQTYQQIKHLVYCVRCEPIKIKGFDEPVVAYRAIELHKRQCLKQSIVSQ